MDIETPIEVKTQYGQLIKASLSHKPSKQKRQSRKKPRKKIEVKTAIIPVLDYEKLGLQDDFKMDIEPKSHQVNPADYYESANFTEWKNRCLRSLDYSIPPLNQNFTEFSKHQLTLIFPQKIKMKQQVKHEPEDDDIYQERRPNRRQKITIPKVKQPRKYEIYREKKKLFVTSRLKNLIDDVQACYNNACYRYKNMEAMCALSYLEALRLTEEQFQNEKVADVPAQPVYNFSINRVQTFHFLRLKKISLLSRVRSKTFDIIDTTPEYQRMRIMEQY